MRAWFLTVEFPRINPRALTVPPIKFSRIKPCLLSHLRWSRAKKGGTGGDILWIEIFRHGSWKSGESGKGLS